MKKLIAIVLAIMLAVSCTIAVSAANATPGTTTLTTTVPDAEYTLNIPADQEVPFGKTSTEIGNITVSESTGFAEGKNLNVSFVYNAFSSEEVSTTIPYTIKGWSNAGNNNGDKFSSEVLASGTTLTFLGQSSGSVASQTQLSIFAHGNTLDHKVDRGFTVEITSEDWGKALGGDYTATITFSAEVVVE